MKKIALLTAATLLPALACAGAPSLDYENGVLVGKFDKKGDSCPDMLLSFKTAAQWPEPFKKVEIVVTLRPTEEAGQCVGRVDPADLSPRTLTPPAVKGMTMRVASFKAGAVQSQKLRLLYECAGTCQLEKIAE